MIKVVAETEETVTVRRSDFEALVRRHEDLTDQAAVAAFFGRRQRLGREEARRLSYTAEEVARMVDDGVSSLTIWRERAGLNGRALANLAGISPSYLSEIEGGVKHGSISTYRALSEVLMVPLELLIH